MKEEENMTNMFAKYKFMIYGMASIITSLAMPTSIVIDYLIEPISLSFLINTFNALGSILIIGGIFEITMKDKFIKDVTKDFIKALFLDKSSLGHFTQDDLFLMKKNLQQALLGKRNYHYKNKFSAMLNDSFFQIARGRHKNKEFNMFFDYYTVVIYIKKSLDSKYVEVEFDLKYKLVNNTFDDEGNPREVENGIFVKRFFPPFAKEEPTQELISMSTTADGIRNTYSATDFTEKIVNKDTSDNVKAIKEDVKKQLQKKTGEEDETEEILLKFKDTLILEKKISVKTLYNDINYTHIFKRPTLNYSIHFIDENVDMSITDVDYLSLRLFSGLNKKNNDKIHPVLKGNSISLTVSDELLLAGEGIMINSVRPKHC